MCITLSDFSMLSEYLNLLTNSPMTFHTFDEDYFPCYSNVGHYFVQQDEDLFCLRQVRDAAGYSLPVSDFTWDDAESTFIHINQYINDLVAVSCSEYAVPCLSYI